MVIPAIRYSTEGEEGKVNRLACKLRGRGSRLVVVSWKSKHGLVCVSRALGKGTPFLPLLVPIEKAECDPSSSECAREPKASAQGLNRCLHSIMLDGRSNILQKDCKQLRYGRAACSDNGTSSGKAIDLCRSLQYVEDKIAPDCEGHISAGQDTQGICNARTCGS